MAERQIEDDSQKKGTRHDRAEQAALRGIITFFNPLDQTMTRKVSLPLYYTGLSSTAWIREQEGAARPFNLGRDYRVELEVTLPPRGVTWFVITDEEEASP